MVRRESGFPRGFVRQEITLAGHIRRYALYIPRDYVPGTPTPMTVFLNGAAECGSDGLRQAAVGLGPAIIHEPEAWPFIVLFPQKPTVFAPWLDFDDMVMAQLEQTRSRYSIDTTRLYLTGISQGGNGAWTLAAKRPDFWAAIAPICGYGNETAIASHLRGLHIWAFHGLEDDVVPPQETITLVRAAERAGADVRMTLYEGVGHNSWDRAYRSEGLGSWFLEHHTATAPLG